MSIATMVRLAAQAEAGPPAAAPEPGRGPQAAGGAAGGAAVASPSIGGAAVSIDSNATSRAQAALEAIASYIPSEALALYIGALGAFQPSSDQAKWIALGFGVLLVIGFAALSAFDRKTRPAPAKIVVVALLAVISFVTYAAALPGSPFLAISAQATVVAGYVAVILSILIPRVAVIAGVAPAGTA